MPRGIAHRWVCPGVRHWTWEPQHPPLSLRSAQGNPGRGSHSGIHTPAPCSSARESQAGPLGLRAVTHCPLLPPQIMTALEANPTARRTQLQHKFEQVVALMEDNIYECYSEA